LWLKLQQKPPKRKEFIQPRRTSCAARWSLPMADIINLRRARKAKQRQAAADTAAQNRARHGQSKAARHKQQAEDQRRDRQLDHAKLDEDTDPLS
jgi:hypothetical protein